MCYTYVRELNIAECFQKLSYKLVIAYGSFFIFQVKFSVVKTVGTTRIAYFLS